jgi:malate dehydrogenase (oxaloacetate-decarboxylating)
MNYDAEAIRRHRETRGKVGIYTKMPLESRDDLSAAYTPGVAAVSMAIARDTEESFAMTNRANTVAVISDGSEVLCLGNIGPEAAMPVMDGKAALFKRLADIDAIPIYFATQDTLMKDVMSKRGAQGTLAYLGPQDQ